MKITENLLSRVIAFIPTGELRPPGGLFPPDLIRELVQRYEFQKFPRSIEDWGGEKSPEFETGRLGKQVVTKLVIWNDGITIETQSGTDVSKQLILEMLGWAKDKFGLTYSPEIIRRWAYVSDLTFVSNVPLLSLSPLDQLAVKMSAELSVIVEQEVSCEPVIVSVGHDPLALRYGRAPFTIQRRSETSFSENRYFSEAPLPTETHIKLLTEFENDVKEALPKAVRRQ